MNPALELARKLVDRLLQFELIEDHGERAPDGATIWHPTESGRELQIEAQIADRAGLVNLCDEHVHHLIWRGLVELDRHYRWKPTELAEVLLKLPCALPPPVRTASDTLH
jgi:hypothetical protein